MLVFHRAWPDLQRMKLLLPGGAVLPGQFPPSLFARQRQTGEREAVIGMTPPFPYGRTTTLTANPPKTGGPKFPENRENNREFRKSEAIPALLLIS